MNRNELKRLAQNPSFITGIYNYCDRWCERCDFTSRCLNFEMGNEKFGDLKDMDINNKAFWDGLSETFQETLFLLEEMAEDMGLDLNSLEMDQDMVRKRHFEKGTVVHIISHMAKSYTSMVDECFGSEIYVPADEEYSTAKIPGPESTPPGDDDTEKLNDSAEVIRWYQQQIYVKLNRALSSATSEAEEKWDDAPKDSDGSAKVALIGINRSISAWGIFLKHCPYHRKKIINVISHLSRLCNITEKVFPGARAFIRPGFDQ